MVHQTSPNQRLTTHWQFFPAEDTPIVITSGVPEFGTSNPTVYPIEIWHPMASISQEVWRQPGVSLCGTENVVV